VFLEDLFNQLFLVLRGLGCYLAGKLVKVNEQFVFEPSSPFHMFTTSISSSGECAIATINISTLIYLINEVICAFANLALSIREYFKYYCQQLPSFCHIDGL